MRATLTCTWLDLNKHVITWPHQIETLLDVLLFQLQSGLFLRVCTALLNFLTIHTTALRALSPVLPQCHSGFLGPPNNITHEPIHRHSALQNQSLIDLIKSS